MFTLIIALYTVNHPIKTVYLHYPTQFTCQAAEEMIQNDKNALYAFTKKKRVVAFATSCEQGGPVI